MYLETEIVCKHFDFLLVQIGFMCLPIIGIDINSPGQLIAIICWDQGWGVGKKFTTSDS